MQNKNSIKKKKRCFETEIQNEVNEIKIKIKKQELEKRNNV